MKGVSFQLERGEVHALLGENGAGKSTLIKMMTGALRPDSGTVRLDGEVIPRMNPALARARGVACIYQQPALFPELTVAENIALRVEPPRIARRIDWPARREEAARLLRKLGAAVDPESHVSELSMPAQQLVEIAAALGAGARIMIMDEPTASLTETEQERLFTVIAELRVQGMGIIYISHRLAEIFKVANRVTVLRDGESMATHALAELNESRLIHLMVGREISQLYPGSEGPPAGVVLSLKEVGCAAAGIHRINLEVRAGEVVGLAGLVGAGRTELARVLFGLTPADAGEIMLGGRRVTIASAAQAVDLGIAYVPEDRRRHGIVGPMSLASNLTLAIHRRIFPNLWLRLGAERNLAQQLIHDLDIRAAGPAAAADSLSGGNQQKVSLGRWLATEPRLLILDEPTQGVDVGAKSEIHRIIRGLARKGLAVLMISSDLPEVLGMSDRVAVMRGGTIRAVFPHPAPAAAVMAAALGHDETR